MTQSDNSQPLTELHTLSDAVEAAKSARLRYVTDTKPGIRRELQGDEFVYIGVDGNQITKPSELQRIRALGIPPAYTDVWISPLANGHIQATGRDAKGRKQYRYHQRWREIRDETKFTRMLAFGAALPKIRDRVDQDLQLSGMPRAKVLATVVRLLELTLIRVGNEEYARDNKTYGLTTMRDKHVDITGTTVQFTFRGKSGIQHTIDIKDRKLAQIVKRSRDLPGYELFQYIDADGQKQDVTSSDVNDYLKEIGGEEFTAKDFRTWAGTVIAALALQSLSPAEQDTQAKKNVVEAVKTVAERLGNTPAVSRKNYIHPAVIDAYLEGAVIDTLEQLMEQELQDRNAPPGLKPEEVALIRLLQKRLQQERVQDQQRS